jgi:diguanylate cyclase (GGDEF)-like protein/PAS domain S-box-containing protein
MIIMSSDIETDNYLIYKASFDYASLGLCHLKLDGSFLHVNSKFCEMLEYANAEIYNLNFKDIILKEDFKGYEEQFDKLITGKIASFVIDIRYVRKDKSIFWAAKSADLICDDNGNPSFILVSINDITRQKENEELLRISRERFKSAFNLSPDAININRLSDGVYIEINNGFTKLTGYTVNEVIGKSSIDLNIWNDINDRKRLAGELQRKGYCNNLEAKFKGKSDDIHIALMSAKIIRINDEDCILSITRDITERRKLEHEMYKKKKLLDITLASVGDGVISTDTYGKVVMINKMAQNLTGFSENEAIGMHFNDMFPIINENTRIRNENPIKKVLETGKIIGLANHTLLLSKNGKEIPIEDSAAPIMDEQGKIHGVVLVFRDVSNERMKQKENEYIMSHDQLTGLFNRKHFYDKMCELDNQKRCPISIIMADVNGLKLINDAFGHAVGDELLQKTAGILRCVCQNNEIVARLGGDEFVILLPNSSKEEATLIIGEIKKKIIGAKVNNLPITISLGCDTKKDNSFDLHKILKKAEDQMYIDKLFEGPAIRSNTITAIINTLHEKNYAEKKHAERVSELCGEIATAIGMSDEKVAELKAVGLLHDIGKIAINNDILFKEGSLNKEEIDEVRRHSEIGYRILSTINEMSDLAEYVLYHHERWDGKGYPKGSAGDFIPIESRIIAIADSFDAMTNDRPYRKALTVEQAIAQLKKNSGKQFDAKIVEAFIKYLLPKI